MIIATLIAAGRLDRDSIAQAAACLEGSRLKPGAWRWIDEGDAADIEIAGGAFELAEARAALDACIPGVDVVVQEAALREKKLLVADMDSTMIGQECIDELADYAGAKLAVAAITEQAMRGAMDFATALRERVAVLDGLDAEVIERCRIERVRANPGARALVATMRARGAATLLVTGGFTAFAEPVATELGFAEVRANRLGIAGGRLNGSVEGPIVDGKAKCDALVEVRDRLGLAAADTLAVGDGANDRAMVEAAGLGVAYRAKPALIAVADARIDHNDLTALLWAQGIARRDWVDG
ncbi:phosphoserine phosphatase SerB [Sphingomonas sp.]|uniref:phosphoserine phosphatase SerB n=1 Tax=Sphingomonas sp. TaxID=28214 RepID=UPI00286EA7AF|nr:phosphoserine phosphatase SerB [Sphingomonas sp.]